jgi:DNA uptake protein ComE-like DNA-binding protein
MLNVNTETSALKIYDTLLRSIRSIYPVVDDPNIAQLAVNMVDFVDDDDTNLDGILDVNDANCVSTLVDASGIIHYGFEAQPFINEIAWEIGPSPPLTPNFFALELCNPFDKDIDLGGFVLEFLNRNDPADQYTITFPAGELIEANGYFVLVNQAGRFAVYNDPNTPVTIRVEPALRFFENWVDAEFDRSKPPPDSRPDPDKSKPPIPQGVWGNIYDVSLKRLDVPTEDGEGIYIDNQIIDDSNALLGSTLAFGRDDLEWRIIYQTLAIDTYGGSLGIANYPHIPRSTHLYSFFMPNPLKSEPSFITVGDIPRILTLGHGTTRDSSIGRQLMAYELLEASTAIDQEHNVRLDVQNPLHRNVFQYLTVFDPNSDGIDNDTDGVIDEDDGSEWKVPGRININTAPWYVLAQLPWVSAHTPAYELAKAIIEHRDTVGAFGSIAELNFVGAGDPNALRSIGYYARTDGPQAGDLLVFPDLTFGDGVEDDFEERDVIFSRVSNLVTVRSDVFTAYILVRIGADGPQKRAVAILDRSGVNKMNFNLPEGKVRIAAFHYVPDPR